MTTNQVQPALTGKILIVDDAMENIRVLHAALQGAHEVIFALEGARALAMARDQRPDLILLDALMPDMDGYAVCRQLQEMPETRDIPVIFVTSLQDPEDEMRGLAAGAVDFIHKPINAALVQARVHTHLTLKRQRDQLQEAGQLLKDANAALLRSNKDLEHFAHLAAHDLQAPLNSIAGCTQLLAEECAGKLGDPARQYMTYILDSTRRMQTLVQDLLAYSQVDNQARPLEVVELNKVFEEVLFILRDPIGRAQAQVCRDTLPAVRVDRQQMTQLFMNLIQNGIKYNRQERPEVQVSARREGNEWIFAVRDNGIGIDPRFHEQVFEIFRRLHSSQAYPGSGIGLAMCHRIVTRHGGRIWVESQEGQGSTFFFTLPAEA